MSNPILSIRGLTKSFRSHWTFRSIPAVRGITFDVAPGEAFGFLGPNGAGKTTTIKCVLGLIRKSAGEILLDGEPLQHPAQRRAIGYLPELPYFYDHLTVRETLELFASLHGMRGKERRRKVEAVATRVGLDSRLPASVRTLSKGLQQRLAFAQAILNDPKLVLLDEPFSGLDPVGRREMRELLLELRGNGTSLFLSSHVLSDIEEICDRVSVMSAGTLRTVFAMRDIPRLFGEHFEITVHEGDTPQPAIRQIAAGADEAAERATGVGLVWVLHYQDYEPAAAALRSLMEQGVRVEEFRGVRPSLEEIFVHMTGPRVSSSPSPQTQTHTMAHDIEEHPQ